MSAVSTIYSAPSIGTGIRHVNPARLATLLLAICLGRLFADRTCDAGSSLPLFHAASSLLCHPSSHYLTRNSLAVVEALHMMVSFLFALGDPEAAKAAWPTLGLCVRLASAMGLHRDSRRWGYFCEGRDQRERLWWECFTYDIL